MRSACPILVLGESARYGRIPGFEHAAVRVKVSRRSKLIEEPVAWYCVVMVHGRVASFKQPSRGSFVSSHGCPFQCFSDKISMQEFHCRDQVFHMRQLVDARCPGRSSFQVRHIMLLLHDVSAGECHRSFATVVSSVVDEEICTILFEELIRKNLAAGTTSTGTMPMLSLDKLRAHLDSMPCRTNYCNGTNWVGECLGRDAVKLCFSRCHDSRGKDTYGVSAYFNAAEEWLRCRADAWNLS